MSGRDINWLPFIHAPTGDRPRHVPWPGIELVNFHFVDWHPTAWATLVRAASFYFNSALPFGTSGHSPNLSSFWFWKGESSPEIPRPRGFSPSQEASHTTGKWKLRSGVAHFLDKCTPGAPAWPGLGIRPRFAQVCECAPYNICPFSRQPEDTEGHILMISSTLPMVLSVWEAGSLTWPPNSHWQMNGHAVRRAPVHLGHLVQASTAPGYRERQTQEHNRRAQQQQNRWAREARKGDTAKQVSQHIWQVAQGS